MPFGKDIDSESVSVRGGSVFPELECTVLCARAERMGRLRVRIIVRGSCGVEMGLGVE
jgi:hypothetical protein